MKQGLGVCIAVGVLTVFAGCAAARQTGDRAKSSIVPEGYWPTSTCRGCHDQITQQHLESSHETSFTNPVFQAQYQKVLLPEAAKDADLLAEARQCIACHEPITYATKGPCVVSPADVDPRMNGVTCDVCHTITGYDPPKPQNGNYIMAPSEQKLGPLQTQSDWHSAYSELQTKSEICAVCHEAVNRHGFQVKATFTEWKESDFARRGVQCQDCHMNVDGFLVAGKPRFSSGKAAWMSIGNAPERERLYTHRFPGAHSRSQVEGVIQLAIEAAPMDEDRMIAIGITVDNTRTGHSMPSGSADLRLLWLEVTARTGNQTILLPAEAPAPGGEDEAGLYALAGYGKSDSILVGPEVPVGSRLYRAIYSNASGEPTLDSYDAAGKLFDNRLKAGEKRREPYRLHVPESASGDIRITAVLKYLPYSSIFSDRFGLAVPEAVIVARQETRLSEQVP
jgi:hypothetical protein